MALKVKPTCNECDKELSSKQSLKNHMMTVHDGLKGIKSLFSSPKAAQQQKKHCNAKVLSEGEFVCADCSKKFTNNESVMNHTCNAHDKDNVVEENDVVESTETNDDLENTEHGEKEVVDDESVNTEHADIEVVNEDDENADELCMAEELERFAKLAETVSYIGSKCHDCEQRKEAITHKDNIINIQESKLKDTQTRLIKCGKEKSSLIKEKKAFNTTINRLKTELLNSQNSQKESKKQLKILQSKITEKRPEVNNKEDEVISIKCRECSFVGGNKEELRQHHRDEKAKTKAKASENKDTSEEGPLHGEDVNCDQCSYQNRNRVLLNEHREKNHKEVKCEICGNISPNMATSKTHALIHRAEINKIHSASYYPGQSNNFKCTPCRRTFKSNEDLMSHLSEDHQRLVTEQHQQVVDPQVSFAEMAASPGGQQQSGQGGRQQQQGGSHQQQQSVQGGQMYSFQGQHQQQSNHSGQQSFQVGHKQQQNFQGGYQQQQQFQGGQRQQQQSRQKKGVEPSWTQATHQPVEEWLPRLKCQKCRYETNTQNELVHHIETKHNQANIKCDNCPQTFLNSESLVTHIGQKHTRYQQQPSSNRSVIESQINCVNWSCSFCGEEFQGKEVRDNHFCQEHPFRTVQRQGKTIWKNKIQEECKRGAECHHWKAGTCWFSHVKIVERPAEVQQPSRNTRRADMWCAYQDRCNRRQFCEFKHIDQEKDFIQHVLRGTGM